MHDDMETVFTKGDSGTQLQCPFAGCDQSERTHVVNVRWEMDPEEGRKRLCLEVRCENSHNFVLAIRNHEGVSYFEWEVLLDNQSTVARPRASTL